MAPDYRTGQVLGRDEWIEFRLATVGRLRGVAGSGSGGRWLFEPLVELASHGYCYDLELPSGYWDALQHWMKSHGLWNETFLGEGARCACGAGLRGTRRAPGFLYRQYQQALAGVDEGYCLGEVGSPNAVEPGQCLAVVHARRLKSAPRSHGTQCAIQAADISKHWRR